MKSLPGIPARLVAGSLFTLAIVAIAAVAAWPVYRSWDFVVLVVVSAAAAVGVAALASWRSWSGWLVAATLAGAIAVLGVPLAVPSRRGSASEILRGLGEVAVGSVLAWKDLVTVELPVGSYRNLLVPALLVFLIGTCALLLLSWRAQRIAFLAVPVGLAMVSFGLFFGSPHVSAPVVLGPVVLYAPAETAVGVAALLAALLWLGWRSRQERVAALQRAASSSGVRMPTRPTAADRRRVALGGGMLVVAVIAAVVVVPFAAQAASRDVLRSAAGPDIDLSLQVSPLAQYRSLFAQDRAEEVVFSVTGRALPERVRVATLDSYDGEVFRPGGGDSADQARFVRVPSTLAAGEGEAIDMTVTIGTLGGVWMPTAGRLASVDFAGPRAGSLVERFYYSASAAAGVQTAGGGLEEGDVYRLNAVAPEIPDLAEIEAPGGVSGAVGGPESLRTWVEGHIAGTDGAALQALVELLRERGYLSHALSIDVADPPAWTRSLSDYRFQPSAAGHSLARIGTLFTRMLEREGDARAEQTGNYVAAIGDDEQFAVAAALIARELGFPSRVVLGARLTSSDPALAACDDGTCRAQDLSVWAEVKSADGTWVPVDATPQYAQSPSLDVTEQRDPENVTEVRPDAAQEVVPPEPVQEDSATGEGDQSTDAVDLAWLLPALRIAGIALVGLAVVLGPFLVIVGAKAARRRGRRTRGDTVARIAGGWDEYVDAAVDAGREVPRTHTRAELAAAFATGSGSDLAVRADRAVFGGSPADEQDAAEFWRIVEDERRILTRSDGVWAGLVAAVSLKSFLRPLASAPSRRPSGRTVERGRRRAEELARTTP